MNLKAKVKKFKAKVNKKVCVHQHHTWSHIVKLEQQVNSVLEKIPGPLQEAVQRLLNRDPHPRPTTQLLPLIKYFKFKNLLSKCKRGFIRRENRGFLSTIQEELDSDSDDDEDYI
ncbi:unnamed protein product [Plutella xylostella]|uniref:(diamondback moth) hypothetical protein n=1 Tax=Plutella xylostella TaxID=51655 RepID=A0A8S4GBG6_PLUXY|nr:unnamed protein product [Plutella xylostella]